MAIATAVRTDEQIQKDVRAELEWDHRVSPNEVGVAVLILRLGPQHETRRTTVRS
jgi:hypothetical protein